MPENFNPLKRKKKRSFVQSVKKKFKNARNFGHGTHLDQDTHEYFLRVFEHSRQSFENSEEKSIFVENVFTQTIGHEVEYSKNQLVSRVLEHLLPFTKDVTLERFLTTFSDDLRSVCVHEYASHVIEKLVCVSTNKVHEESGGKSSDASSPSNYQSIPSFAFVMKISKFLANNLDEFVMDYYANHVIRATISCLANIMPEKQRDKGKETKNSKLFESNSAMADLNIEKLNKQSEFNPPEFVQILVEIAERILNSPSFIDFPHETLMSCLLQTILLSLKFVKKKSLLKEIIEKLLATTYAKVHEGSDANCNELPELFESQPACRLLETCLDVSPKKQLSKIYKQCFAGRLAILARGRCSNFAVRKLLQRCADKDEFNYIYCELFESAHLREIVTSPAFPVVVSVANACRRLCTKQATFVKDLSEALDALNNSSQLGIASALLNLEANIGKSVSDKKPSINPLGSIILQEILRFQKRAKIVKSLLSIDNEELIRVLSDPRGSHIADAFFAGDACTGQDIERMINKLKGSLAELAASKHGSFVLTALWKRCPPLAVKLVVVEELANSPLAKGPTSKGESIVANQIGLDDYLRQPKQWKKAQMKINEARETFEELKADPITAEK